ncbi:MAG: exodeoxyribonuclease VII large subunit [Algicola sp.]|nr:exodeoxyribonuclease VII large subunit [Algicola sp.]
MAKLAPAQNILTVSQLNQTVRRLLESEFSGIWLTGEISNFVRPASGHWYFSLKDDSAQIRGAMFRGSNRNCRIKPQDGMQVLVRARLSLYEPRGDYQIIVEQMEPAGDGLLKQQFEQLKNQLAAQGLFAQSHKLPLPKTINRVGVITSHTGAAVRDIIAVLKRRAPQLEVIIYPTQVQGQMATQQIASMIQLAEFRNEVDVLIVGRGGGSLEDLWCFNEEVVARAIYNCKIPIVSAVGHEIDVTISDYVADVRAATPSAAAELVSPDTGALVQHIEQYKAQLCRAMSRRLNDAKNHGLLVEQQLLHLHPQNVLNNHAQKIDELSLRLNTAIKLRIGNNNNGLNHMVSRFKLAQTALNIVHKQSQSKYLAEQLNQLMTVKLTDYKNRIETQAKQLDIVSPLKTLGRGYSITMDDNQQVIKSAAQLKADDLIETKLVDGSVKSRVVCVS